MSETRVTGCPAEPDSIERMLALRAVAHLRNRSKYTPRRPALHLNAVQRAARERVVDAYATKWSIEEAICLCGASEGVVVTEHDRYGLPCRSLLCTGCGVIRTSPRLDGASLDDFYANDYRPLYGGSTEASEDFFRGMIRQGGYVRDFLGARLIDNAVVADIGCGAGGLLLPLRDVGCRVFGCDLGGEYLQRGRAHGLDLRRGSYAVLADEGPFDLVILSHVLEHISDISGFLTGVKPLMANDGLIYVELPGIHWISKHYGDPLRYFQNAHMWGFDLASLSSAMAREGWQLVHGSEYIRAVFTAAEHTTQTVSSYDANIRALAIAERSRMLSSLRNNVRFLRLRSRAR